MGITHRKRNAWLAAVRPLAVRSEGLPLDLPALEAEELHATDKYLVSKGILPGTGAHAGAYRKLIAFVRPREPGVAAFSEAVDKPRLRSATLRSLGETLRRSGGAFVHGKYADAVYYLSRAEADYVALGDHEGFRLGQHDTREERLAASDLSQGKFVEGATRLATLLVKVEGRHGHESRSQLSALVPSLYRLLWRMWRADKSFLKDAPALVEALTPLLQLDHVFEFPGNVQGALLAQIAPPDNTAHT